MDNNTLDSALATIKRKRALLPIWIKIFLWIFLIFGFLIPVILVIRLLGHYPLLSIFGLSTNDPFTSVGLVIIVIFLWKAIVAYSLWTERDHGIEWARYDAILSILICAFMMIGMPFLSQDSGFHMEIRLELVVLIPYFLFTNRIREEWEAL